MSVGILPTIRPDRRPAPLAPLAAVVQLAGLVEMAHQGGPRAALTAPNQAPATSDDLAPAHRPLPLVSHLPFFLYLSATFKIASFLSTAIATSPISSIFLSSFIYQRLF